MKKREGANLGGTFPIKRICLLIICNIYNVETHTCIYTQLRTYARTYVPTQGREGERRAARRNR